MSTFSKNKSKKTGIGIVGLGSISTTHAEAINNLDDAELVAACSRSEVNRDTFKQKFNVPVYADYEEFLSHTSLDVVTICTPSGSHLDFGKLAAKAGKHLVIEKPIEISVERGRELLKHCNQNGVQLAVIYQNRFIDGVQQMKQAVAAGEIGTPIMVRASVKWYRDQKYYSESGWRGTLKMDGGGAVINQAIHTVDLLIWMMGEITSLSAYTEKLTHPGIEAEDNAVAVMKFKSGALGVFEASTSIVPAQSRSLEINGSEGTVLLDGDQFQLVRKGVETEADEKSKKGAESPLSGVKAADHQAQYEKIVNALSNDETPIVSGEESLQSLAVVEAIYRSAGSGKRISPDSILFQE